VKENPMGKTDEWFAVDRKGLAQILERRGKAFAVLELLSNAWDQNVTTVDVALVAADKRATYRLVVTDDDPDGFADLTHAYTLFAPSVKKGDAEKRGRFNLGEKLVLALCDEAVIASTKGTIHFSAAGRTAGTRRTRDAGSEFRGVVRMNQREYTEVCTAVGTVIPPAGITTTFNGVTIPVRVPVHFFDVSLLTEVADDEGNLRRATRKTRVTLYEPLPGETPTVYEMGIPVVEQDDRWHIDVGQKVPMNMDRDGVPPAWLRTVRTAILNETFDRLSAEEANSTWAKEAAEDPRASTDAVSAWVEKRFGDKVVAYDPSDREANNIAVAQGYTVVHGSQMSKAGWQNVRRAEAIQPAGKVTPSPSALLNDLFGPNGKDITVPDEKRTDGQHRMIAYARDVSRHLLGFEVAVNIVSEMTAPAAAWYGSRTLTFNVGRLGHAWFDRPDQERVDALLIHEFAHDRAANHLDHSFHDECCRLGARLRTYTGTVLSMAVDAG
jgi:hypothetical protein